MIFHITTQGEWAAGLAQGAYVALSFATEGFIHSSLLRQVAGVHHRFFAGQTDLVVLVIDPSRLNAELRYDPVAQDHFPHIYGPINPSAVVRVVTVPPGADIASLLGTEY